MGNTTTGMGRMELKGQGGREKNHTDVNGTISRGDIGK